MSGHFNINHTRVLSFLLHFFPYSVSVVFFRRRCCCFILFAFAFNFDVAFSDVPDIWARLWLVSNIHINHLLATLTDNSLYFTLRWAILIFSVRYFESTRISKLCYSITVNSKKPKKCCIIYNNEPTMRSLRINHVRNENNE